MSGTVDESSRLSSSAICDRPSSVRSTESAIKKVQTVRSASTKRRSSRSFRGSRRAPARLSNVGTTAGIAGRASTNLIDLPALDINARRATDRDSIIASNLGGVGLVPLPAENSSTFSTIPSLERVRLTVVVFGAPRVGKTALIDQFLQKGLGEDAYQPTRRREVHYPVAFTNERIYELEIVDTCTLNVSNLFAYAKRNLSINLSDKHQLLDADPADIQACNLAICYLLVYDATNFESFIFIQRVRHHLLTLLSTGAGVVRQQSFDGDSFTQFSGAELDTNAVDQPYDGANALGYRNGRYISMIVAANKLDVPHVALTLDTAILNSQLPHSSSTHHLQRSRSLLRYRLRQLRELTAGRSGNDREKDRDASFHHHTDSHHSTLHHHSELHHHGSHHHHHHHHSNSHPSFTLSHPSGIEQSMSVSSSSTTQSQNVSCVRPQSQSTQLLEEYVRKSWRVTHIDVSAKRNYHVSLLFREIVRDFEMREADERNHLQHTHTSRLENALRSRFGHKNAETACVIL